MIGANYYSGDVKRLLLLIIIAVIGGYAAMHFLPGGNKSGGPATTQSAPKIKVKVTPWSGAGTRKYDATFIHSGGNSSKGPSVISILIISVRFTRLNHALATVSVFMSVPRAAASKRLPSYVQVRSFSAVAPDGTSWSPMLTSSLSGADIHVRLIFRNIPSRAIGAGLYNRSRAIELNLPKPGGSFQVALVPPIPPAGHSFAESPIPKAKHKAKHTSKHKG